MSYITRICHSSSKLLSYSSLCNFLLCLLATLKDLSRLTVPSRFYLFPTIPPPSILFPLFSSPPRWYSRDTLRFLFFFFFSIPKKEKTRPIARESPFSPLPSENSFPRTGNWRRSTYRKFEFGGIYFWRETSRLVELNPSASLSSRPSFTHGSAVIRSIGARAPCTHTKR